MPLSEDEQRILRQIEEELAQDPSFAERGQHVSRRRLLGLGLALLLGIVATVAALSVNQFVAFVAFVVVFGIGLLFERELRLVTRAAVGQLPVSAWLSGNFRNRP